MSFKTLTFRVFTIVAILGAGGAAYALPTSVMIAPSNGARFLPGQKFDLRVEGKGTGPFSSTIAIDGIPQTFTSGVQNSNTTDNISAAGFGGFNLRGYFSFHRGIHTITATFTDSTGTVNVSSQFTIVDLDRFLQRDDDDER